MKKILLYIIPIVMNIMFGVLYAVEFNAGGETISVDLMLFYNIIINPLIMMIVTNKLLKEKQRCFLPMCLCIICSTIPANIVNIIWIMVDGYKFVVNYFANDFVARTLFAYEMIIPGMICSLFCIIQLIRYKMIPQIKKKQGYSNH